METLKYQGAVGARHLPCTGSSPTDRPCSSCPGCVAAQTLRALPWVAPAADFVSLNLQVTSLCFLLSCWL